MSRKRFFFPILVELSCGKNSSGSKLSCLWQTIFIWNLFKSPRWESAWWCGISQMQVFWFHEFFFKFSYEYFDLTSFCFKLLIWFFYFSYCDKELKLFVDLRKHIFNIHNLLDHVVPSQIKFDCSQCEKKFIREELLKSHVELIHQGYR